uniref:Ras-GEF domain-containing protein n=1 Tax=Arcella intermedia TaxID=1963864 RepID=A0A6B2KWT1_9EUKA
MIEKITSANETDPEFFQDFLLTYRAFLSPEEFLKQLIGRFSNSQDKIIRLRVFNCFRVWLEKFWYDFEASKCEDALRDFIKTIEPNDTLSKTVLNLLERQHQAREKPSVTTTPPPTFVPKEKDTFLDMKSLEIARQITLVESNLYMKIHHWELIGFNSTRKDSMAKSKNLTAMLERNNYISNWTATLLCNLDKAKDRSKLFAKFIDIAMELKKIGNFNGVFEILAGLNKAAIQRLAQTREILQEKHKSLYKAFQDLTLLVDPKNQFASLKRAVKEAVGPCLPYVGQFLAEIAMIEEAGKEDSEVIINVSKLKSMSEILSLFKSSQIPIIFTEVPAVMVKIESEMVYDDDELNQLSLWCEPRPGTEKGEKPVFSQARRKGKIPDARIELEFTSEWPYFARDDPTNILMENEDTIKSGTIHKVIERLTHQGRTDSKSLPFFLVSYRLVLKPQELLDLLIVRITKIPNPVEKSPESLQAWNTDLKTPISLRIFNFLRLWIVNCWYDFDEDEDLKKKLIDFITNTLPEYSAAASIELLKSSIKKQQESYLTLKKLQDEEVASKDFDDSFSLLSYPVNDVALNMTYYVWKSLSKIKQDDLITTPEPLNLRNFNTNITFTEMWISQEIENCAKKGSGLQIFKYLIELCRILKSLNNWLSLNCVVNSLTKAAIPMKTIWEFLPHTEHQLFKQIVSDLSKEDLLPSCLPPCIPIIKNFIQAATNIINNAEKTSVAEKYNHINMVKLRSLAEVYNNFLKSRQPYDLSPNHEILSYLKFKIENNEKIKGLVEMHIPEAASWAIGNVGNTTSSTDSVRPSAFHIKRPKAKEAILEMIKNDTEIRDYLVTIVKKSMDAEISQLRNELKIQLTPVNDTPQTTQSSSALLSRTRSKSNLLFAKVTPTERKTVMDLETVEDQQDPEQQEDLMNNHKVTSALSKYFTSSDFPQWSFDTSLLQNPSVSIYIGKKQGIDFLIYPKKAFTQKDLEDLMKLGRHYRKAHFSAPICSCVVCFQISEEISEYCKLAKIKVFKV